MNPTPRLRTAFTLVELLVVLAIIGVLVAVLLPAIQSARESSRRVTCVNHLRQVGVAVHVFESQYGKYPAGRIGCDDTGDQMPIPVCPPGLTPEQKSGASGFVLILPMIDERALYDQLDLRNGGLWNRNVDHLAWYSQQPKCQGIKRRVAVYVCPSDFVSQPVSLVYVPVIAATSNYAFVHGTLGPDRPLAEAKYFNTGMFLYVKQRRPQHVRDGLSRTTMVGEVVLTDTWESSNTWSYALVHSDCLRTTCNPLNTPPGTGEWILHRQNGAFASNHTGGANFCYGDGHVEFLNDDVAIDVYRSLSNISQ